MSIEFDEMCGVEAIARTAHYGDLMCNVCKRCWPSVEIENSLTPEQWVEGALGWFALTQVVSVGLEYGRQGKECKTGRRWVVKPNLRPEEVLARRRLVVEDKK